MKKIHKFVIGGISLTALVKLVNLEQQLFDIGALFGLVIMGVFLGLIGYALFGKAEDKVTQKLEKDESIKKNEAKRVYEEVERKKSNAKNLEVDGLITKLYFEKIQYYPSWIKNPELCSLVTEAASLPNENRNDREWKKTKIRLKGKEYTFACEMHTPFDGDGLTGTLELYDGDKKVLVLDVAQEFGEYIDKYLAFGIEGFIEGQWISDFKELEQKSEEEYKLRQEKEREAPEKIKKLKENFGMD